MYKCLINLSLALFWVGCLISCSPANNKPVIVRFSPDSNALVFTGIDPAGLFQLKNSPHIDTAYSHIISVSELPHEDNTDLEQFFPGKVVVGDSAIVFHPQSPFVAGRRYLILSYLNAKFGNASMMLTGKLDHTVKPQEVILQR